MAPKDWVKRSAAAVSLGESITLDAAMKLHIVQALQATQGRIEGRFGAAARLGVNAHTLRARMRKLGIEWGRYRKHNL
jgi:transcriptional regulator with GAF, ATPase, and Fis domain